MPTVFEFCKKGMKEKYKLKPEALLRKPSALPQTEACPNYRAPDGRHDALHAVLKLNLHFHRLSGHLKSRTGPLSKPRKSIRQYFGRWNGFDKDFSRTNLRTGL